MDYRDILFVFIAVRCRYSISQFSQSVFAKPMTALFVEISGWSTHDTMSLQNLMNFELPMDFSRV